MGGPAEDISSVGGQSPKTKEGGIEAGKLGEIG
jgi:hypothetical protein